jgi:YD repeat-containing protein
MLPRHGCDGESATADDGPEVECRRSGGAVVRRVVRGGLCGLALAVVVVVGWWLAGSTRAWADVAPSGSFTTDVSVQVPSFHGLQPGLSLQYSSQTGDGWVGEGWALLGTSTVERQSGLRGLPTWTGSDHYALDGVDLVACAGGSARVQASPSCAHPVPNTVGYSSQTENFDRIAFTADGQGGSWTVWRTDGVTVVYRPVVVTDRGVLDWRISTVRDRSGNTVKYHWATVAGQEPELGSISYGDVSISFKTEPRKDPLTTADGDSLFSMDDLLAEIDETAAGKMVRSYHLTYTVHQDRTRESFLQSVTQYGSDNTTAYPTTVYDTDPGHGVTDWQTPNSPRLTALSTGWPAGPADGARWNQSLGGPDQGSLGWPNPSDDVSWLTGDLNRDERQDIIEIRPDGLNLDVHAELNSDTGGYRDFDSQLQFAWPTDTLAAAGLSKDQQTVNDVAGAQIHLADVNGDGYPDLVFTVHESTGDVVGVAFNLTADGPDGQFAVSTAPLTHASGVYVGDVTGDGKADLVATNPIDSTCAGSAPSLTTFIGTGSGAFTRGPTTCWTSNTAGWGILPTLQMVDLNGDLKADLAGYLPAHTAPANLATAHILTAVSTGDGSFIIRTVDTGQPWGATNKIAAISRCPQEPAEGPPYGDECVVTASQPALWGDFDGDRNTDLMVLTEANAAMCSAAPDGTVVAHLFRSNGDGTFASETWSTPLDVSALRQYADVPSSSGVRPCNIASTGPANVVAAPADVLTGDFDGDGQTDLAVLTKNATGTSYTSITRLLNNEHDGFFQSDHKSVSWQVSNCVNAPFSQCDHPRVATGDANADGRDDITVIDGTVGGAAQTVTDITPAGPRLSGLLAGDINGDGVTDEVSVAMASDSTVQVRAYLGAGNGQFARLAPVTISVAGIGLAHLPADGWQLADVTGDHQADLINLPYGAPAGVVLVATAGQGWTEHTVRLTGLDHTLPGVPSGTVTCTPGKPVRCTVTGTTRPIDEPASLPRTGTWQIADVTGDGIPDLVHAGPGPWGTPGVLVLAGSPTGALSTQWSAPPDPATAAALANPLGWHLADVNGDGTVDLVDVDTARGTIHTLLRQNGGWTPFQQFLNATTPPPCPHPSDKCDTPTTLVEATGGDDGAWQPLDLNGDGQTDLARVIVGPVDQLYVEELISLGNGTWQPEPATAITTHGWTNSFLSNEDNEDWLAADVDLDGRGDLIKATQLGPTVNVQMLLSDGAGAWTQTQWRTTSDSPGGADDWRVNSDGGAVTFTHLTNSTGDYKQDQIHSDLAPDTVASTSNGLGATTQVTYSPADTFTAGDTPAPQCQVPQDSGPFVVTTLTTSVQEPGLAQTNPAPAGPTAQPVVYQVRDGDTLSAISRLELGDANRWPQIWAANEDRAEPGGASFTNPTQIRSGWTLTIPAAATPSTLTVTAPRTVSDSSTIRYGCGHYSATLRTFQGWTDTWTTHAAATDPVTGAAARPGSIEHVTRAIDNNSGIDQVILDETTDTNGTPLDRTQTTYQPIGTSAPFVNLTARTDSGNCANNTCADTSTVLTRDSDGNVTDEKDTAAGSGLQRDTTTSYLYDDNAWLHAQGRLTQTYADQNGTQKLIRASLTCYDGDTTPDCDSPQNPTARGLLTATRQLDGSNWITTHTYRYDSFGNPTTDTDANNHTTTTTYDPTGQFPVKTCNALNQCSTASAWDRAAEAPTHATAITGGQTTTQYDPLGRPERTVGPTGIVTTTTYSSSSTGTTTTTSQTAGTLRHWTSTLTDGLGHTVRTQTPGAANQTIETDTTYLDATLPAVQTAPHYTAQTVTNWTATDYDALGRPIDTDNADGSTAHTTYGMANGYDTTLTTNEDGREATALHLTSCNRIRGSSDLI